jgi:hypothetical protein
MLLFRDEEHVNRWCVARDLPRGAVIAPAQAWHLAEGVYRDLSQPHWRRRTPREYMALFREAGLRGPFWELPG